MVLVSELRLSISRDIFTREGDTRVWGVYVMRDGWVADEFALLERWFESYAEAVEFVRSVIRCCRALTGSWVASREPGFALAVALYDMDEPFGTRRDAS